jgi:ferredoxin
MRVTVDTGRCIGAGQCVLSSPDIFDQDANGIVALINTRPDESARDLVRNASVTCPSQSITIHDD